MQFQTYRRLNSFLSHLVFRLHVLLSLKCFVLVIHLYLFVVQLSSGGVLVDVKWPGKKRQQANMRIKASIIETVEKVKEKLEKKVISRLFDENNKYETLRSVIQMLQEVEAFVNEIKGGCFEFWIACENKQRVENEKDAIRLFLAEKLLPEKDASVVSVSILDVDSATYR